MFKNVHPLPLAVLTFIVVVVLGAGLIIAARPEPVEEPTILEGADCTKIYSTMSAHILDCTTHDGLRCIVHESDGGVDCNWEAYNARFE